MSTFRDALARGDRFLFDGSTASMLFERGIALNRSFDECNLKSPELLLAIHGDFLASGAQVLTTNTWGANAARLAAYGLEGQLPQINRRGGELARQAIRQSGVSAFVAGCLGPLGVRIEPWGPTSFDEARAFFREQAVALLEGGVDLFVLESFEDLNEIRQALLAIRDVSDLPIAAMMSTNEAGQVLYSAEAEWFARQLDGWGADLIGINGGNGPALHLRLLERMKGATEKPILLQPSPGLPRMVDGRWIFQASPEYLGEFAGRAFRMGARAVGGCAGTTPAHIRAMRGALAQERAMSASVRFVEVRPEREDAEAQRAGSTAGLAKGHEPKPEVPVQERSRWAEKLANGQFVTSVELVPPKGMEAEKLLEKTRACKALGVDAVNVPDGPRAMARMSALATAVLVERETDIETVLHYACRDRNLLGMQSDLLGAAALGLRNILAVTGDPPKLGPYPQATAVFDVDAIGLVNILKRLNTGLDLGGAEIGRPTPFSLGVGANPVAPDLQREKERFKWKVEAGAQWAITQPIFDPESLFRFLDFAEPFGIPIVAGLWPFKSLRNAEFMAHEVPGVFVPPALLERLRARASAEDQLKEGLDIAMEILEAIRPRIQGLQLSAPFGQVELVAPLVPQAKAKEASA